MKLPSGDSFIRIFAIFGVAVISAYVMWMAYRLNETLSGPGWCKTALGAEKASSTEGAVKGLDACVDLLKIQLKSLSTNSHILLGVVALCLLVLIVIVIARGHLDFSASKTGISGSIGSEVEQAADKVAGAALDKAAEVKADANPDYSGPAMPEPKP
ncbi:MAG: hypothetical protein ACR652_17815 [Methylocystis sp.]|uniref:hypothetical protein n=1 Tax=Methylocystis sp. TaxID=1911079 RepID=UPI003DA637D8